MVPVYIFDIDGTLADHTHRLPLIAADREGGKDWAAFHNACPHDPPIEPMCLLARQLILSSPQVPIIFLTGRMEFQRLMTQAWLAQHLNYGIPSMYKSFVSFPEVVNPSWQPEGPFPWLLMRADGDHRDDTVMKGEWLDRVELYFRVKMPEYKVVMAFEDRPRVCDYWRSRGLVVAKIGDWQETQQAPASEAWQNADQRAIDIGMVPRGGGRQ